jgi:hypothetical protein
MTKENNNGWKKVSQTEIVDCYRNGWLGLWDAVVALVNKRKRKTVAQKLTLSVWVQTPEGHEVNLKLWGAQMEVGFKNDND